MSFYNPSYYLATQGIFVNPGAQIFYVNNGTALAPGAIGGSNGNSGLSPQEPFSTVTYAISQCTAGRGDVIIVMPGHAETRTAVITVNVAGIQVVGVKIGSKRPTFTINGAVDLFSVTAANVTLMSLECNIITTDAATAFVNIAASNVRVSDMYFIPSSGTENVVDVITVASGSDVVIENCKGFNTTVPVVSWIAIETAVARLRISGNTFRGDVTTAGITDAATATQLILENNMIVTIGTNVPACILDSNPTGQAYGNHMYGTDATIANNANWGSALILGNNYTRGGTGSGVSASPVIPANDT